MQRNGVGDLQRGELCVQLDFGEWSNIDRYIGTSIQIILLHLC